MTLLRIWLASFAVAISACSTIGKDVPPPTGNLCSFSKASMVSFCVDITTVKRTGKVPVDQMDKWITMPPATWNSIQDRMDKLENRLQSTALQVMSDDDFFLLSGLGSDLNRFKNHTRKLRAASLR